MENLQEAKAWWGKLKKSQRMVLKEKYEIEGFTFLMSDDEITQVYNAEHPKEAESGEADGWEKFFSDFHKQTDSLDRSHIGNYLAAMKKYISKNNLQISKSNT